MATINIPFSETGYFSPLINAYLSKSEKLKNFYEYDISITQFEIIINDRKNTNVKRDLLYEVFLSQHQSYIEKHPQILTNINAIKEDITFTVTTGHQLCIATGPLYFIYKIASAINLCRQLKAAYPSYNFVPVYWMATEDHDIDEINHIHLFNKKITWNTLQTGASGRLLTNDCQSFFDELNALAGNNEQAKKWVSEFQLAYSNNFTLANATRNLVLQLFGEHGLLVLDADISSLKKELIPVMHKDIFEQTSFKVMNQSIENLVNTGIVAKDKIQVKPREINFFYLTDGSRKRIVNENDTYKVLDTEIEFSKNQLIEIIENNPENLSPNVVLRPIYQEIILPNLAYIGGGGELSYWLEIKDLFNEYNVFFPALILRNSFLFVDEKQEEKFQKLGFNFLQIFESIDNLSKQYVKKNKEIVFDTIKERETFETGFDLLKQKITLIDKSLVASVDAEKQKLIKGLEIIEQKVAKAQKNKFETEINQLTKLKQQLFPEGGLQERFENILSLLFKYEKPIIDLIISEANIFESAFKIIVK